MDKPPFEQLYVLEAEDRPARIYTQLSVARTQVTKLTNGGKHNIVLLPVFTCSVKLWAVGAKGWELLFSAEAGESARLLPWHYTGPKTQRALAREAREEVYQLDYDEAPPAKG